MWGIVTVTDILPGWSAVSATVGGATTKSSQYNLRERRNQRAEAQGPASGEEEDAVLEYRTQVSIHVNQGVYVCMCVTHKQLNCIWPHLDGIPSKYLSLNKGVSLINIPNIGELTSLRWGYGAKRSIVHSGKSSDEPAFLRYRTLSCNLQGFPHQNSISLVRGCFSHRSQGS